MIKFRVYRLKSKSEGIWQVKPNEVYGNILWLCKPPLKFTAIKFLFFTITKNMKY